MTKRLKKCGKTIKRAFLPFFIRHPSHFSCVCYLACRDLKNEEFMGVLNIAGRVFAKEAIGLWLLYAHEAHLLYSLFCFEMGLA